MNDGGPAFPRPGFTPEQTESQEGMTYRQWLIGMATSGILSDPNVRLSSPGHYQAVADQAVNIADAIIAALEKENQTNNQKGN